MTEMETLQSEVEWTESLPSTLRVEAALLFSTAQTTVKRQNISDLLPNVDDWSWFERQTLKHGLSALVHRHLSNYNDEVPDSLLQNLEQQARQVAFHNMRQTQELLRVTKVLEANDIPVIPFKGPALALWGYGDVSLRTFGDLDLLVPYELILDARQCLEQDLGYASHKTFVDGEAQTFVDTGMGWEFIRERPRSVVEIHWSFFFDIYPFALQPGEVWERHVTRIVGGQPVRSFDTTDMLLYLSYHGLKHRFGALKWVVDVREWVLSHPEITWSVVWKRAEEARCLRAVHVALLMADLPQGKPLPDEALREARSDDRAAKLVKQIVDGWLFAEPENSQTETFEDVWFHVRSCDRLVHGIPFVWHYMKLGGQSFVQRLTGN